MIVNLVTPIGAQEKLQYILLSLFLLCQLIMNSRVSCELSVICCVSVSVCSFAYHYEGGEPVTDLDLRGIRTERPWAKTRQGIRNS